MAGRKPDTSALEKFTVTRNEGGGFLLHIETGDDTLEISATRDQLDVMADALDDILAETEEEDEAEGEEE